MSKSFMSGYLVGMVVGVIVIVTTIWTNGDLPYQVSNALRTETQVAAIDAGVAEYYIDKDNNKAFRYIKCDE